MKGVSFSGTGSLTNIKRCYVWAVNGIISQERILETNYSVLKRSLVYGGESVYPTVNNKICLCMIKLHCWYVYRMI